MMLSKKEIAGIMAVIVLYFLSIVGVMFWINTGLRYEDDLVYIADTEEMYHNGKCYHVRESAIPVTMTEAREQNYIPCYICHGNPSGTIYINNYELSILLSFLIANAVAGTVIGGMLFFSIRQEKQNNQT